MATVPEPVVDAGSHRTADAPHRLDAPTANDDGRLVAPAATLLRFRGRRNRPALQLPTMPVINVKVQVRVWLAPLFKRMKGVGGGSIRAKIGNPSAPAEITENGESGACAAMLISTSPQLSPAADALLDVAHWQSIVGGGTGRREDDHEWPVAALDEVRGGDRLPVRDGEKIHGHVALLRAAPAGRYRVVHELVGGLSAIA